MKFKDGEIVYDFKNQEIECRKKKVLEPDREMYFKTEEEIDTMEGNGWMNGKVRCLNRYCQCGKDDPE